jgi:hypothetical protein
MFYCVAEVLDHAFRVGAGIFLEELKEDRSMSEALETMQVLEHTGSLTPAPNHRSSRELLDDDQGRQGLSILHRVSQQRHRLQGSQATSASCPTTRRQPIHCDIQQRPN